MKASILPIACLTALSASATAAIIVPGANGSDGALNITENTVIDLGLAPTGDWDADNSGVNAGKGIYDPAKWAVVFKYSSVNVAAGATVTFKNNASRAPVVWLVSGNVTIAGTVSLDGQNGVEAPLLAEPGPGGFRGGVKDYSAQALSGPGFGMGGGSRISLYSAQADGSAGSFGTPGVGGVAGYGNPSLIPLFGGSGGGGATNTHNNTSASGGAGGGAFLLACSGEVNLTGTLRATGGSSQTGSFVRGGSGSGGGIRIVADTLSGTGAVSCLGGSNHPSGGNGRIRIERITNTATITPTPDPSVVDLAPNATALLWPPSTGPEVRIVSVGGENAPDDPKAGFGTIGADVALSSAATTTVIVETTNVEAASVVKVRATPRSNANFSEVDATLLSTEGTDPLVIRWTATLPVGTGYNAVQARVIRP